MIFEIISMEEFDSYFGKVKKGQGINTLNFETEKECRDWVRDNYGPMGMNIKVKIRRIR